MRRWAFVLMFLAVFALWGQTPTILIDTVASTLPNSSATGNPDYWADKGQQHDVTVHLHILNASAGTDTLKLYQLDCTGSPVLLGTTDISGYGVGSYVWNFPGVTEPACAADTFIDSIWVEHGGTSNFGWNDRAIEIMVLDSAKLSVDTVQSVTAVAEWHQDLFTMGQHFYLKVCVANTGIANAESVHIVVDTTQLSDVACAFETMDTMVGTIHGGETICYYISVVADSVNHGVVGDDEIFTVTVSGKDVNLGTSIPAGNITYNDDEDTIGVVMEPVLEVVRVDASYFSYFTGDGYPWLNRRDWGGYDFLVRSLPGDYAVVDS
ncbi:hypothetical protein J7K99_05795, partial [bacterium]|nr:hypothetical protein [bacterium]